MKKNVRKYDRARSKTYHHPELRQSLITAAIDFLKTNSFTELSLRSIARKLGVSHMAPYRHFKTKEELLAAIIEDGFVRMTFEFDKILNGNFSNYREKFSAMGKAYVYFIVSNSAQARLMFSGILCDAEKYESTHQAGHESFACLLKLIEEGQSNGHLVKENSHAMGLMIWASVHGTAVLLLEDQFNMLNGNSTFNIDHFMDYMLEKLLKAVSK